MPVIVLIALVLLGWASRQGGPLKVEPDARNAVRPGHGWTESPLHRPLFTPARVPEGTYRTYVTSRSLEDVARELGFGFETVVALDAFGQSGGYNRWALAQLYGAKRARVARGPRLENGLVVEAWTLISPYPDPSLKRLEPGTLLIVLNLRGEKEIDESTD
jgi:hypothetical protein